MTAVPLGARRFDIGRVVERTFGVTSRNFVSFYLLALLLSGVPNAVMSMLIRGYRTGSFSLTTALAVMAGALVSMITSLLVQGALVWGAIADLNGRKATVGELLRNGLHRALPILGISIVFGLGVGLGFIFFVVPGVILSVMWSVAVPVTVVERPPGVGALGRSSALTRGSRWAIFALMVIYLIAASVLGGVAAAAGVMLSPGSPQFVIFTSLVNGVVVVVGAIGGAVLYTELRASKEGIEPETLAAVFD